MAFFIYLAVLYQRPRPQLWRRERTSNKVKRNNLHRSSVLHFTFPDRPPPPNPKGSSLVLISVKRWVGTKAIMQLEILALLKSVDNVIWNRTRYLINRPRYRMPSMRLTAPHMFISYRTLSWVSLPHTCSYHGGPCHGSHCPTHVRIMEDPVMGLTAPHMFVSCKTTLSMYG
jgi:hypothetical protein